MLASRGKRVKERPGKINGLRQTGVYSLVSLLVWQPILVHADVAATELPQANVDWVSQGAASRVETATDLLVKQVSDRVSLQWDSFNVGKDATVKFEQPNSSSIALNRVVGGGDAASRINGKLSANGIIYIIDSNGVIFGKNSVVEVASLIASSLNVDEDLIMNESFVKAINDGKAAFEGGAAENSVIVLEGSIDGVEGARIITGEGGSVFLFAPKVETQKGSSITTPGGQTILAAAKDQVYLAASQDPDLRGMLVEVSGRDENGNGGSIDHAGKILADRGNITLAALNIDQRGQLKATTSVDANGTIRLLARDTVAADRIAEMEVTPGNIPQQLVAGVLVADGALAGGMDGVKVAKALEAGRVTFHEGSVTEVVPEASNKKAADSNAQPVSFVEVMGKTIDVMNDATITSRGGVVSMVATAAPGDPIASATVKNDSRLTLHEGSRIDVSGMDTAQVEMERNSLEIELRGDELKDSPLQRNDADIRGEKAYVDIRDTDDIEFADISAYLAKVERSVDERLSAGGKVNVYSEGTVDFQQGAQVDISGGAVNYRSGYVLESQLVDDGNLVAISDADPNVNYDAVISGNERYNERWNIVEKIKSSTVGAGKGTFVQGYVEGKDAGSFNIKTNAIEFGGKVIADTVSGPYQRTGNKQVFGGKVDPDLSYFQSSQQSVSLVNEDEYQQYLQDRLAGTAADNLTKISVDRFANSADSVSIKTRGDMLLSGDAHLALDGGGALALSASDVTLSGDITNRSGDVTVEAKAFQSSDASVHTLQMDDGASIDTSGNWINDNPLLGASLNAPVHMDAGNISLKADGSVLVDEGASLQANGGAWLSAGGKLQEGNGGNINLSASRFSLGGELDFRGDASSYSLKKGGTLTLGAAGFDIGAQDSVDDDNGRVQVSPEDLQRGGFSKVVLNAGLSGIDVAEDTQINLVGQQYLLRDVQLRNVASGADMNSLVQVADTATLRGDLRAGVDLTLRSTEDSIDAANRGALQDGIRIGSGSVINALPGANVTLESKGGGIDFGGSIIAKGGDVKLDVAPTLTSFDPTPAVRLRDGSLIDVGATVVDGAQNGAGIPDREFHDAGSVSISAMAGYVLAENGASVTADGLATEIRYFDTRSNTIVSDSVNLAGGGIALTASEGILFNGDLSAKAAGVDGRAGSLDVNMTTSGRQVDGTIVATEPSFKDYELEIRVTDDELDNPLLQTILQSTNIAGAIAGTTSITNGVAYLGVEQLNAGEFAHIGLHTFNDSQAQAGTGTLKPETRIVFDTDKTLTAAESIRLETPAIVVNGAAASVDAPYVAIGTRYTNDQNSRAGGALPLNGSFTANAEFIDLLGDVAFRDAQKVMLNSHGDIRLRGGLAAEGARDLPAGSLKAYGDVELLASQIYTATQTSYTFDLPSANSVFTARNQSDGTFRIDDEYAVYSALGTLNVNADHIVQDGTLKAPFGEINLNGRQSLILEDGSKTSVSGEAQTVIVGEVQADGSWLYPVKPDQPQVINTLKEKSVSLKSPSLEHKEGAVVDISGGGDLLAYEFVPGPGGSRDVLSYGFNGGAGDSFAIVPTYGSAWGAYDTVEMASFPYAVGDTIRFENVAGLDSATGYAILPARYALLPGAYLVTPRGTATQPALNGKTVYGAIVAAGKLGNAGSGMTDSLWSSFVIEPGSVALTRSEINLYSASRFFDASGTRPQDAGRIAYDAIDKLDIDGDILAASSGDGVGGRMDVTAADIQIVGSQSDGVDGIQLVAGELEQLNVDSILLGGTRSTTAEGSSISVSANSVTVAGDVDLTVSELLLAARQNVTVEAGAQIAATRTGKTSGGAVSVSGNGALVQASVGDALQVQRRNASGSTGALSIQETASVFGQGALVLNASGSAIIKGSIDTQGTAGFGSGKLVLGVEDAASGMALSQAALNSLGARELLLTSLSSIDVASDFSLDINRLTLDAAAINATGGAPVSAQFNVTESVTLQNTSGVVAADVAQAGGELAVNTAQVNLVGGQTAETVVKAGGFDSVSIAATGSLNTSGKFALQTSSDTTVSTARLNAAAGSDLSLKSAGDLTVASTGTATGIASDGLGASLLFEGDHVSLDTQVKAASGLVQVKAENGITLGEHAVLDVSGRVMNFAGDTVVSDAGGISLVTTHGDIASHQDAVIDVSAPAVTAASGSLTLSAANGAVDLQSAPVVNRFAQSTGGSVTVDVAQADNVQALLPTLSGFHESQSWRARNGDITLTQDSNVQANSIEFSADSGSLTVNGKLDASGVKGGAIGLYAGNDVQLGSAALLDASATGNDSTGNNAEGGKVVLSAREGFVTLADGSAIDVSGSGSGRGGSVQFQTARNANNDDVNFSDAGVDIMGADRIVVAGFQRYDTAVVDQSLVDGVVKTDTASFMAAIAEKLDDLAGRFSNLVSNSSDVFEVAPGVEFFSAGDLVVDGGINLAPSVQVNPDTGETSVSDDWRYGDNQTPGFLRFVATDDLTVNGDVSDGFVTLDYFPQSAPIAARSWNLAFVAGANQDSANPLAVNGHGDITLTSGSRIRTGTGDIDLAAGGDLSMQDGAAIYNGGQSQYVTDVLGSNPESGTIDTYQWLYGGVMSNGQRVFYGHAGGDINVDVGRDITMEGASRKTTDWLYRIEGEQEFTTLDSSLNLVTFSKYMSTWGVQYDNFANGIGTLGGGDIDVNVGRDAVNLTLAAPTTAMQIGAIPVDGNSVSSNEVLIRGGGDIAVTTGNDILSGHYLVSDGRLSVIAGGSMMNAAQNDVATAVTFGKADMSLKARKHIDVTRVMDQGMVTLSELQSASDAAKSLYFTDASADSLMVQSITGNIRFNPDSGDDFASKLHAVLPADVQALALDGNIQIDKAIGLEPHSENALKLYAARNIEWASEGVLRLTAATQQLLPYQGDALAYQMPDSPEKITTLLGHLGIEENRVALEAGVESVHTEPGGDPLRLVALTGDLVGDASSILGFHSSKETEVVAGRDIRNLGMTLTNNFASDVSRVSAGRDIVVEASRSANGEILASNTEMAITVDGPGSLLVTAGRDINLGTSGGIVSQGNITNTALADVGADLMVLAGIAENPDFDGFTARYMNGTDGDLALSSFLAAAFNNLDMDVNDMLALAGETLSPEQIAALPGDVPADMKSAFSTTDAKELNGAQKVFLSLSREDRIAIARAQFEDSNERQQQIIVYNTLLNEVKRGGAEDSSKKSDDGFDPARDGFTRSFAAINSLFGSNVDWQGDLSLVFSTINTKDGGDIGILTPGGGVDVGLPIQLPGVVKEPAELGIITTRTGDLSMMVAESVRVNQSRTFALDGDIMMWSSTGDIDAGRGAKTATGKSEVTVTVNAEGKVVVDYGAVVAGSGIRGAGDVSLFAPAGVIDAGDAGIGASGNVILAAQQVIGADNIDVGGVSIGVPVNTGVSSSVAAASGSASAATSSATGEVAEQAEGENGAGEQVAFLTVEIIGLGE